MFFITLMVQDFKVVDKDTKERCFLEQKSHTDALHDHLMRTGIFELLRCYFMWTLIKKVSSHFDTNKKSCLLPRSSMLF